jgi:hypothetical protein
MLLREILDSEKRAFPSLLCKLQRTYQRSKNKEIAFHDRKFFGGMAEMFNIFRELPLL